jgi:hypothetical protein
MEYLTFQKVNGCVEDAYKVLVVQLNVAFVRTEVELSNKQMMVDGLMLFVDFGFLKFDSPTQCSSSR